MPGACLHNAGPWPFVIRNPWNLFGTRCRKPGQVLFLILCSRGTPSIRKRGRFLPRTAISYCHGPNQELWDGLRFDEPYICIGGGALASTQPEHAARCYARLVDGLRDLGYRVILTENDVPDSFLRKVAAEEKAGIVPFNAPILLCGAVLAHARLFVSGRYHPSIFASLGGTPCIFLGSHAHKMGSLARVLDYDSQREFSAFPDEDESAEIVATAKDYLRQGKSLRTASSVSQKFVLSKPVPCRCFC